MDQIDDISVLKTFIEKLYPEEQDAIFKVAATRGHLKTLAILGKIDEEKYSMIEAGKIAVKRHLEPIVAKYLHNSTNFFNIDRKIGLDDEKTSSNPIEKILVSKEDQALFIRLKKKVFEESQIIKKLREAFEPKDILGTSLMISKKRESDVSDDQLQVIAVGVNDMLNRMHPTKFKALMSMFHQFEQEKTVLYKTKKLVSSLFLKELKN